MGARRGASGLLRGTIVSAGLLAVVLALAGGCSSGSDSVDLSARGSTVITAKGGNVPHFDPKTIKVPAGQQVTFTFKNDDSVPHNFTVSYLDVHVDAAPGQSVPVTLTAPNKGTLDFYDAKFQGEGMAGKIEVE